MYFLNAKYKVKIIFLIILFPIRAWSTSPLPDSSFLSTAVTRSFEPFNIKNSSPNHSIIFDESGLLFLGQKDKIGIFNGNKWTYVYLKGENLITKNANNVVFFSCENKIGYLFPDSSGTFIPRFLNSLLPENLRYSCHITASRSIGNTTYFQTDSILFSFNTKSFRVLDDNFSGARIFTCGQKLISLKPGNIIEVINGDKFEKKVIFPAASIQLILENKDGYLIYSSDNKCFHTDFAFNLRTELKNSGEIPVNGILMNTGEYLLYDKNGNLLLKNTDGVTGANYNEFDIPKSRIIDLTQDKSGNVWILQEKSLSVIEYPSEIRQINYLPEVKGEINDIKSIDRRIYLSTTNGLFYLESGTNKLQKTLITECCYKLIPVSQGLICISDGKIFLIRSNKISLICTRNNISQIWNSEYQKLIVSESGKINVFSFEQDQKIDSLNFPVDITPQIMISRDSSIWISDGKNLNYYRNIFRKEQVNHILLPDKQYINALFFWNNKLHIITEAKVFSVSDSIIEYERSLSNLVSRGIFLTLSTDKDGNLYILSETQDKNFELVYANPIQKSFTKTILPKFLNITNPVIDFTDDLRVLLSTGTKIYILDLQKLNSRISDFGTIITEINTGKENIFKGSSYDYFRVPLRTKLNNIPYSQRKVSVGLSATQLTDNLIRYQYFLKGKDKTWSEWSCNPFINFNNLCEGQYDLKIRSADFSGNSSLETSIIFRINPPFYRSWWAYLFYVLALGVLGFMYYKSYILKQHKKQSESREKNPEPQFVPAEADNGNHRKYDFYSNIDEKKEKEKTRWDKYEMVTVLFSDIQGFTKIAESMNPELLIDELDRFFFHFDSVVEKFNIEKIKTIGDAYMAAGGIPVKSSTSPIEVVLAALEMQNYMKQLKKTKIDIWDLRIGIHSGPVIAGIIGLKKRSFDIWGDTVNTASRMESTGEAGKVNISSETYKLVKDYFICEYRGKLPVKYKGNIDMYFVKGLRPELSINLAGIPNRKFFLKLQMLRLNDLEEMVFSKLEADLHKNMFFHNLEYTKHIYEYSGLLTKAADLELEDTLLIRTAALLMNVGYTSVYENQENKSAEFARATLPAYNYSEKQILTISNLILSTKWPPEPRNLIEMVLFDIKMEYIGRADFTRLYKLLFLEQNNYLRSVDVFEFKRNHIEIIQSYPFFTDAARRLREIPSEEQLKHIKDDEWK